MVKIKVLDAVINGNGAGAVLDVAEHEADYLESIGYAERVAEPAKPVAKQTARKQKPKEEEEK